MSSIWMQIAVTIVLLCMVAAGSSLSVEWVQDPSLRGIIRDERGAVIDSIPYMISDSISTSTSRLRLYQSVHLSNPYVVCHRLYLYDHQSDTSTRINYPTWIPFLTNLNTMPESDRRIVSISEQDSDNISQSGTFSCRSASSHEAASFEQVLEYPLLTSPSHLFKESQDDGSSYCSDIGTGSKLSRSSSSAGLRQLPSEGIPQPLTDDCEITKFPDAVSDIMEEIHPTMIISECVSVTAMAAHLHSDPLNVDRKIEVPPALADLSQSLLEQPSFMTKCEVDAESIDPAMLQSMIGTHHVRPSDIESIEQIDEVTAQLLQQCRDESAGNVNKHVHDLVNTICGRSRSAKAPAFGSCKTRARTELDKGLTALILPGRYDTLAVFAGLDLSRFEREPVVELLLKVRGAILDLAADRTGTVLALFRKRIQTRWLRDHVCQLVESISAKNLSDLESELVSLQTNIDLFYGTHTAVGDQPSAAAEWATETGIVTTTPTDAITTPTTNLTTATNTEGGSAVCCIVTEVQPDSVPETRRVTTDDSPEGGASQSSNAGASVTVSKRARKRNKSRLKRVSEPQSTISEVKLPPTLSPHTTASAPGHSQSCVVSLSGKKLDEKHKPIAEEILHMSEHMALESIPDLSPVLNSIFHPASIPHTDSDHPRLELDTRSRFVADTVDHGLAAVRRVWSAWITSWLAGLDLMSAVILSPQNTPTDTHDLQFITHVMLGPCENLQILLRIRFEKQAAADLVDLVDEQYRHLPPEMRRLTAAAEWPDVREAIAQQVRLSRRGLVGMLLDAIPDELARWLELIRDELAQLKQPSIANSDKYWSAFSRLEARLHDLDAAEALLSMEPVPVHMTNQLSDIDRAFLSELKAVSVPDPLPDLNVACSSCPDLDLEALRQEKDLSLLVKKIVTAHRNYSLQCLEHSILNEFLFVFGSYLDLKRDQEFLLHSDAAIVAGQVMAVATECVSLFKHYRQIKWRAMAPQFLNSPVARGAIELLTSNDLSIMKRNPAGTEKLIRKHSRMLFRRVHMNESAFVVKTPIVQQHLLFQIGNLLHSESHPIFLKAVQQFLSTPEPQPLGL